MQKAIEIAQRIITNDPIAVVLIIFLIGLAISINNDFNKIKRLHRRAIAIAEGMDFSAFKDVKVTKSKRKSKKEREAMRLAGELEMLQKMRF